MKYPEHKLSMETALPSSVQSWLGNELEIRGIDSVIYSRYIIHLLLEDHDEECTEYIELFFNPRLDLKNKIKNRKHSHSQEEKRKQAAIDCLQAVTEEKCGIEKLVEDLCIKLKELSQSSGSDDTDQGDSTPTLSDSSCSELEDPAERYYAAFPALTGQNEKSNQDGYHQNPDIWKDNPWIKSPPDEQQIVMQKEKKISKRREEKKSKKRSPKFDTKKKTLEKLIPKPKAKPTEIYHARFMSWPQSEFIQGNELILQSKEEKKLCRQVEYILKEMLLNGKDKKLKERKAYDSDGIISPELQENALWYTPKFTEILIPVESRQRLYERRSCPFLHNDDVFIDPHYTVDNSNQTSGEDQFGLHDLMKNQELQNVAESVLQNVDEDFSKNDIEVDEEAHPQFGLSMYQDIDSTLDLDGQVAKPSQSPYDNSTQFPVQDLNGDQATYDQWSITENNSAEITFNPCLLWENEEENNFNIPQESNNYSPLHLNLPGDGLNDYADPSNGASLTPIILTCCKTNSFEHGYDTSGYGNGNFSQLWDINIWNKTHNHPQKPNKSFLDGFDSSFDEFKSGLGQLNEKHLATNNRNSGILNMLNDDFETVDLLDLLDGENVNTLIPKITFEAEDYDYDEVQRQVDNLQTIKRGYDRSISLTDMHLLKSIRDDQQSCTDILSKSFELIPSNNSAFKDVIPKRLTHVHSDSNISYFSLSAAINFEESVSKEHHEEEIKNENLYLSPKTHFRPISSLADDDMSDLHLRDLFGGHSSSRTQYQKYQDVSDSGDEDSFVPMFKICKQHEKYIQTGTGMDEQPETSDHMSFEDQGRPPEQVVDDEDDKELAQDFDVYGYVDSLTASVQNTPQNLLDVACNTCFDSGYEEANDEEKLVEDRGNFSIAIERKKHQSKALEWPEQQKTEDQSLLNDQDFWVIADSDNAGDINYGIPDNIWSCNEENTFPDMFSFFTEDCDDLRPVEPMKEHSEPNSHPSCYLADVAYREMEKNIQASTETPSYVASDNVTKVKLVIGKGKKVLQDIENCPRENTMSVSQPVNVKGYMPMPSVAVYSCELEKEWLDTGSMQSYAKTKTLKGSGRKPCTFFMEGSCKRSDCKFSHDLSSITCRFWEEGDCFKGDLCPFLHGYYVSDLPIDSKENIDDQFELQEEEFPHLSHPVKKQKQKSQKPEKLNSYTESRKIYRTSGVKQRFMSKSLDKTEK